MNLASFFYFFLFAAGKHTCEGLNVCGFASEIPTVQPSQQLRTRAHSYLSLSRSPSRTLQSTTRRESQSEEGGGIGSLWSLQSLLLDEKHSSSHSYWWIASKRGSLTGETWLQIIWQIGATISDCHFCHQIQCQFSATFNQFITLFTHTKQRGRGRRNQIMIPD